MRAGRLMAALVLLPLLTGATQGAEPSVVLADWRHGDFATGAPFAIDEPPLNAARIPLAPDACPRRVLVDLLYSPAEAGADVPGVGSAALLYEWRAELWRDGALLASRALFASGYGHALGQTGGDDGAYEVRVWLRTGANVSWDARVRGWAVAGEPACLDPVRIAEVEANPRGADAGREWVELHNPGAAVLDLSGWALETTHGTTARLVLPEGTRLAPDERLVVVFAEGQALDNEDEAVVLRDAMGLERDRTPALSDGADDARSWQRDAQGAWAFAEATPGEAPPKG